MSAELGGVVDLVAGIAVGAAAVTGAVAKGVALGTVYLGKAAYHGAVALTKMSAQAAKAVGSTVAGAYNEMQELHKIVAEEKKRHREAYDAYVDSLEADEDRRKQYLKKLEGMVSFDALGIDKQSKNKLCKLADGEKIEIFNKLINLQGKFNDISNVFFGLADYGIEPECEYEFYIIKKKFAQNVKDGNYDFESIFEELEKLLSQIRNLQSGIDNAEAAKFITAQLFQIENELGSPILTEFNAELYQKLCMPEKNAESAEEKLFAVEKDVLALVQLFSDFNYGFEECEEFSNLLNSVKGIITSEDSAETKLQLMDARYRRMIDIYKKVSMRHGEALELKRRYNEVISLNYNLREYLSMPLPQLDFEFKTASADISRIAAENAELAKLAAERQKSEYIRKFVRETMKEMQFEYICSQATERANGESIQTDVYHIEDGNVVSVTFVNGRVCCSVSGVKLAGIAENKGSVVSSMKKFCSKRGQIRQKLHDKGVSLEFDEHIEPNERYATEITLQNASAAATERIRGAKLKVRRPAGAKKKTIK